MAAGFLNLLAFVASVSRQSFAPHFALHSKWSSLTGFLLGFMAMAWALSEVPQVCTVLALYTAYVQFGGYTAHGDISTSAALMRPSQM